MKLNTDDISKGKLDGETVWVCDFRFDDYSNKPIRKVKPVEAVIKSGSTSKENGYGSLSHFVKKKDMKTIIKLNDNSYRCTPLAVFDNQEECEKHYEKQKIEAQEGFNAHIKYLQENFEGYLK